MFGTISSLCQGLSSFCPDLRIKTCDAGVIFSKFLKSAGSKFREKSRKSDSASNELHQVHQIQQRQQARAPNALYESPVRCGSSRRALHATAQLHHQSQGQVSHNFPLSSSAFSSENSALLLADMSGVRQPLSSSSSVFSAGCTDDSPACPMRLPSRCRMICSIHSFDGLLHCFHPSIHFPPICQSAFNNRSVQVESCSQGRVELHLQFAVCKENCAFAKVRIAAIRG